jgi:putative spermidine/putrescine transport system ATP-binding protein
MLAGRVEARVFLGNHWLYQVQTPLGLVQISQSNRGAPSSAEGDTVSLRWAAEHAHVVPRAGAAQ